MKDAVIEATHYTLFLQTTISAICCNIFRVFSTSVTEALRKDSYEQFHGPSWHFCEPFSYASTPHVLQRAWTINVNFSFTPFSIHPKIREVMLSQIYMFANGTILNSPFLFSLWGHLFIASRNKLMCNLLRNIIFILIVLVFIWWSILQIIWL